MGDKEKSRGKLPAARRAGARAATMCAIAALALGGGLYGARALADGSRQSAPPAPLRSAALEALSGGDAAAASAPANHAR